MRKTIVEPENQTPVAREADVIVCGGGPAGVNAAIAAARTGARTMLIEVHGCLGGVWTAGNLSWVLQSENKRGIIDEIQAELERRDARQQGPSSRGGFAYDVEEMKRVLDEMVLRAGVVTRLHTQVVAARTDGSGRLTHVITESKSGRECWAARAFVDCTGDGDLAARAGCGFDMGDPETGLVQPMSMTAIITGVQADQVRPFVGGMISGAKKRLYEEIQRGGYDPSCSIPLFVEIHRDLFALMGNHEYGNRCDDADAISRATMQARAEVHEIVRALRSLGDPWSSMRVVATGSQIGIREGRRIHGHYTVTAEDVAECRTHDDAVCTGSKGFDVHATDPSKSKSVSRNGAPRLTRSPGQITYDIPYRAIVAKDVQGLLLAGRCISGDFLAHSSYRDTGNAVALGQAAGVAAALCARRDTTPDSLPFALVRGGIDDIIAGTSPYQRPQPGGRRAARP